MQQRESNSTIATYTATSQTHTLQQTEGSTPNNRRYRTGKELGHQGTISCDGSNTRAYPIHRMLQMSLCCAACIKEFGGYCCPFAEEGFGSFCLPSYNSERKTIVYLEETSTGNPFYYVMAYSLPPMQHFDKADGNRHTTLENAPLSSSIILDRRIVQKRCLWHLGCTLYPSFRRKS